MLGWVGVQMMALRMEHAPVATKEDGDEEGRLCALCKQNCYFSFVAWCVARRHCLGLSVRFGPQIPTAFGAWFG